MRRWREVRLRGRLRERRKWSLQGTWWPSSGNCEGSCSGCWGNQCKDKEKRGGAFADRSSLPEISKVALAEAKAEEDLGQMIVCVPDPDSKVEKTWDLYEAYRFVRIGAFTDITSLLTASTPSRVTSYRWFCKSNQHISLVYKKNLVVAVSQGLNVGWTSFSCRLNTVYVLFKCLLDTVEILTTLRYRWNAVEVSLRCRWEIV